MRGPLVMRAPQGHSGAHPGCRANCDMCKSQQSHPALVNRQSLQGGQGQKQGDLRGRNIPSLGEPQTMQGHPDAPNRRNNQGK